MKAIAQKFKYQKPLITKPNIIHVPHQQWKDNKKRMFQWADNQAAKYGLSGNKVNVLKTIVANTNEKGVTFITLESIRNKLIDRFGKAAPSRQTIDRYIAQFVQLKIIKRSTQERVKTLVKTRLLMGKLASGSTSKWGTEYISPQRYIYTGKVIPSSITAFPSTNNQSVQKSHHKPASATALDASSLAGMIVVEEKRTLISDEERLKGKQQFEQIRKRLKDKK